MDERFRVEVISQTPNPQQVAYAAMHQDYAEEFVWQGKESFPDEAEAGELVVKYLLKGNRGHYGPLEHPQIILNFGYFPHSTMQQVRTHRNVSFDVQSFRYTGKRIIDVVALSDPIAIAKGRSMTIPKSCENRTWNGVWTAVNAMLSVLETVLQKNMLAD